MTMDNPLDRGAFAEAADERGRMGRISGYLWIVGPLVGAGAP